MYNVSVMGKYGLNKSSGKNFCDELWVKLVRLNFDNKCPICESLGLPLDDKMLNAHHLISRRVYRYRWDVQNGILICPKHHEFDLVLSAHTAPWAFEEWIKINRPEQYNQWVINRNNLESDGVYKYEEIYHNLEEQYKAKTGQYYMIKRINMYLLSKNKSQIIMAKNMQGKSLKELSLQYDVTESTMKKFLGL